MTGPVKMRTTAGSQDGEGGNWTGAETARAFARLANSGGLDLPLPGSGRTRERWAVLAELAEAVLSLARLAEGHTDAVAILAELGAPPIRPGSRWGIWAAQPPGPGLAASQSGSGWRVDGEAHARRVADLTVYLRQHHAERDLARLGGIVAGGGARW
jgi:hypothetical protein